MAGEISNYNEDSLRGASPEEIEFLAKWQKWKERVTDVFDEMDPNFGYTYSFVGVAVLRKYSKENEREFLFGNLPRLLEDLDEEGSIRILKGVRGVDAEAREFIYMSRR